MTLDSSGGGLSGGATCHACNTRGSGRGVCKQCGTAFSKRHEPGTIIGSYRLHEVIGEGGMGLVYLATHTRLGRRVAIKMLRSHYTTNEQAIHRFFGEARAVNKIHHPNIVEITDFIEQPGSDNFYVMELLEGSSLAKVIAQTPILPLARSMGIMMQVASAVDAVHRAGIVHRDIKPDNVFLTERRGQKDFVKVVDFGVAKLTGDNDEFIAANNTNPGAIVGTPHYMSPEQASGSAVDHRTDIYAFGAMLYEVVTGRLPLTGANFGEIVVQLLTVPPVPPRDVPNLPHVIPESLQELILNCLEKQTVDRPDSMETVAERLAEIADEQDWIVYELNVMASGPIARIQKVPTERSEPLPAPPAPAPIAQAPAPAVVEERPTPSPITRRSTRMVASAIAAAVAIALVAVFLLTRHSSSTASERLTVNVQNEIRIADDRMSAGKLVTPDGDDALGHLLAARKLDPNNAAVRDRLHALATTYEKLATQAQAADSLPEAAAHLQVVLDAEPDNRAAADQMKEIETKILEQQRAKGLR